MSFWHFLMWAVMGIVVAAWVTRHMQRQNILSSTALRRRLRYLQPYIPAEHATQKGSSCD